MNHLALLLAHKHAWSEAETVELKVYRVRARRLGEASALTHVARYNLAGIQLRNDEFEDAVAGLRPSCAYQSAQASIRDAHLEAVRARRAQAADCTATLGLALRGWARQGGGTKAADKPGALLGEAFRAAQQGEQSSAGDALAAAAALTAAEAAGVGADARAYEDALVRRDAADTALATALEAAATDTDAHRAELTAARDKAADQIRILAGRLKAGSPRYWNFRSPEPVDIATLQGSGGAGGAVPLLNADEALISFLLPVGSDALGGGLVFAVTREKVAWARVDMTRSAMRSTVRALRKQIDPESYGAHVDDDPAAPAATRRYLKFDRAAAHSLYQALFGASEIQDAIADKGVWLIVPAGPLVSLPPGILVTGEPPGGPEGDSSPGELRRTPWLLREKALAVLPTVSSLRTLRQLLPGPGQGGSDPLLAFADPDFGGVADGAGSDTTVPRGFDAYYRAGAPQVEALRRLPRLPGTRVEAEALELALGAKPSSLLTGHSASKAELMARNADGRLAKVRVLEFATHGLVAGDLSGMAEPALALAAGDRPEDTLLRASEASTLKINADWVLLSACNTASPDAPEAQGLSGLTRAFFFAGARSLLVSHWRVRDDVGARLIPSMLAAQQKDPALTKAQALQMASLAILDDGAPRDAFPFAWAPFVLIGEPGR